MFGKIRDFFDDEINLCIIVKGAKDAYLLTKILEAEVKRYKMECVHFDKPFDSLIRIDLAYNRYEILMKSLWMCGYDFKSYNKEGMIDEMVNTKIND